VRRVSAPPPRLPRALLGAIAVLVLDAALLALALGGVDAMARDYHARALLALSVTSALVLGLLRPARGQDTSERRADPLVMLMLLVVPLLAPIAGAFAWRMGWAVARPANTVGWTGVALVAIGLAIRIAAMAALGPRFSPLVALQRDHALETRGPYAIVRHPGYLGALTACLGGTIAFGSWAATPLFVIMLIAQLTRGGGEEKLLAERFGGQWKTYASRTGAILPGIGRD
jgi:protein-S-isoprenylcysteine O-methyltransferase Ste14